MTQLDEQVIILFERMIQSWELVDENDEEALEFWKECNLVYDGSKE